MYPHLVPSKTPQFLPMFSWETRTKVRSLLSFPMLRKDFVGSPLKGSLLSKHGDGFVNAQHLLISNEKKKKKTSFLQHLPNHFFWGGGPNYIYIYIYFFGGGGSKKHPDFEGESSPRVCCVPCAATKELSSFRCLDDLTGTSRYQDARR